MTQRVLDFDRLAPYTCSKATTMVFTPGNPLDYEDERLRRIESRDFGPSRRWRKVFIGGCVLLALFAVLATFGLPGVGLALVPIGAFMVLGAGLQMLLDRISG